MHEKKLLRSVALEGVTAAAETKAAGKTTTSAGAPPPPSAVEEFIAGVDQEDVKEERETKAENVNEYKESAKAYGSSAKMKSKPGALGKGAAGKKAVSADVTAK
jgi:hypothetical protein